MKKNAIWIILFLPWIVFYNCSGSKKNKPNVESGKNEQIITNKKTYYSQDGHFEINFPGEPTVSTEVIPTEIGDLDMKMFMYEKNIFEAYIVTYTTYPEELINGTDPMEMLESSKKGVLENIQATPISEKQFELEGYNGIYFKANGNNVYVHYKMLMIKNRLFQILVQKDGKFAEEKEALDFLDSFKIVD